MNVPLFNPPTGHKTPLSCHIRGTLRIGRTSRRCSTLGACAAGLPRKPGRTEALVRPALRRLGGVATSDGGRTVAEPLSLWIVNQYALPPDEAGITRNYSLAERMLDVGVESLIIASPTSYLSRQQNGPIASSVDRTRSVPFLWIPAPRYRGNGLMRILNMLVFAALAVVTPLVQLRRRRIPAPDVI